MDEFNNFVYEWKNIVNCCTCELWMGEFLNFDSCVYEWKNIVNCRNCFQFPISIVQRDSEAYLEWSVPLKQNSLWRVILKYLHWWDSFSIFTCLRKFLKSLHGWESFWNLYMVETVLETFTRLNRFLNTFT